VVATFGVSQTYNLPTVIDPEGLSFIMTIISGPSFVNEISNTQILINPTNCNTDIGSFTLIIKIEDGEPKST
jgi:hypothetical protein